MNQRSGDSQSKSVAADGAIAPSLWALILSPYSLDHVGVSAVGREGEVVARPGPSFGLETTSAG